MVNAGTFDRIRCRINQLPSLFVEHDLCTSPEIDHPELRLRAVEVAVAALEEGKSWLEAAAAVKLCAED